MFSIVLTAGALPTASSNANFGVYVTLLRSCSVIWTWPSVLMPWLTLQCFSTSSVLKSLCSPADPVAIWHVGVIKCGRIHSCSCRWRQGWV